MNDEAIKDELLAELTLGTADSNATWDDLMKQMALRDALRPPEPKWVMVESGFQPVNWTKQLLDAVLFGEIPCPHCNGKKSYEVVEQCEGTEKRRTRVFCCPCKERMRGMLMYLNRLLPPRYLRSNLWTLQPSPASRMSLERQTKALNVLRANPDSGYFFYGAPGTSKTTFATALVRRAFDRDWSTKLWYQDDCCAYTLDFKSSLWIHYLNWDSYIQSLLDYQNHPDEAPAPTLSPKLIRENAEKGRRSCIAIEEIDKSRLTEFKTNKLFDLVNAIDATKSQLILTTNHETEDSFQTWLYKTDNEAVNISGKPIWRRIADNCKIIECKAQ